MKSPVVKVSKNVGLNPVARAVARQRLISAVTSYRISVYMNEQGQHAAADYMTLSVIFKATLGAMNSFDSDEFLALQEGLRLVLRAEARGGAWDNADVLPIDKALQVVQSEFPKLSPEAANKSIQQVLGGAA